ncbi:NAD-dependent epimerase/dehydratase family protein [Gallionella capsiferriformans]|jgi:nucleoside-diphosphate-sugar epimerase|nr:NAD(P)-dependent oxidoreductase [Gallionella capsiferriformans]
MKKRILLTGVTGFLGSHLAKELLAAGNEVVALKRKSSSLHRVESIISEIDFFDIEGLDFDQFFRDCGKIDTIIHTATCYGRNNESVTEIFAANTEFPLRLLDAGSRAGVEAFLNTDTILDKYLNLYALSKNQLLQWGKFFSIHEKMRFANIRLEHFYGPDDDPTKFSAYVINSCLGNVPELRLTKGEQRRDFIYIDDVVSAYMVLLEKMDSFNSVFVEFDVGSGRSVSIREFVETVHRITASKTYLDFGALPYREGEVMHSEADITKLAALGWRCQYDLETGLKKVIEQERTKL